MLTEHFVPLVMDPLTIQRVLKHGKDSRFDEIKKNPGQFSVAW
jgi:hypothetical protein